MVSLECRAAGTAAAADASALRELLQGLSGYPPARVFQHELVLKGPGQERQAAELRLTHHLPLPPADTPKQWQRDRVVGCAPAVSSYSAVSTSHCAQTEKDLPCQAGQQMFILTNATCWQQGLIDAAMAQ